MIKYCKDCAQQMEPIYEPEEVFCKTIFGYEFKIWKWIKSYSCVDCFEAPRKRYEDQIFEAGWNAACDKLVRTH